MKSLFVGLIISLILVACGPKPVAEPVAPPSAPASVAPPAPVTQPVVVADPAVVTPEVEDAGPLAVTAGPTVAVSQPAVVPTTAPSSPASK